MAATNKPTTYRFSEETNDQLDRIVLHLQGLTGAPHSRADAIRYAVKETLARLRTETRERGEKNSGKKHD